MRSPNSMRPAAELATILDAPVIAVFTDIDDTLTSDGRLPAIAYTALERLHDAGIAVVPVTGRPAGWCDMIARFWPVAGVIGENGAFSFHYDEPSRRMIRSYIVDAPTRAADRERLRELGERIIAAVPGAAISADQRYRESDLAIDFAEDVGPLDPAEIDAIVAHFRAAGATAKVSSIHVNGWYGTYDKLTTAKQFCSDVLHHDLERENGRFVFVGDSPNDEPMFAYFHNSCGVANVNDFADRLDHPPHFVASARGGRGFVEIADAVLTARDRYASAS